MKERHGFVSNSSTATFIIIGYMIDENKIPEKDLFGLVYGKEKLDKYANDSYEMNWDDLDVDTRWELKYEISRHKGDISILIDDNAPDGHVVIGLGEQIDDDSVNLSIPISEVLKKLENLPKEITDGEELQFMAHTVMN